MNKTILNVEYDLVIVMDFLESHESSNFKISEKLIDLLVKEQIPHKFFKLNCLAEYLIRIEELKALSNINTFIVHIIAHGNQKCIGFKQTGEKILWVDMYESLKIINSYMNGQLCINFSSCLGLNAIKIVNMREEALPFFGIIGYETELKVNRAIEINEMFYKGMLEELPIPSIVNSINDFFKDNHLQCFTSEGYKQIIENKLKKS